MDQIVVTLDPYGSSGPPGLDVAVQLGLLIILVDLAVPAAMRLPWNATMPDVLLAGLGLLGTVSIFAMAHLRRAPARLTVDRLGVHLAYPDGVVELGREGLAGATAVQGGVRLPAVDRFLPAAGLTERELASVARLLDTLAAAPSDGPVPAALRRLVDLA
ncbi:MAG: hypothetical protein KC656_12180 [Myxococcales bacterium]|nr:hypothetical protein [Myxococcales bacterium]